MADRLRLVVKGEYGKTPETHLNFADGTYVNPIRDSFQFTGPEHSPVTAMPQGRWGGQRVVSETHNNGTVAIRLLVRDPASAEAALGRVAELIEHADHYSQYGQRTFIEWRPEGATKSTYFQLRGSPTWEPQYRWITFQSGGHSVELGLTFPVAPLAEGGEMDIFDDFSPRGNVLYTNYCSNPSFEIDASGWAPALSGGITATLARSTAWASEGVASGRMLVTANTGGSLTVDSQWVESGTGGIPVVPGQTWTLTAVVNVTVNSSSGIYARLNFRKNDSTSLLTVTGTKLTGTGVKTVTVTGVAPAGAAYVNPRIGITTASTELIDYSIDKVTASPTADAIVPFTGDSEAGNWTNIPQQSTSCLYNDSSRNDYRQDAGAASDFAIGGGNHVPLTANAVNLAQTQRGYPVPDAQATIEFTTGSVVTNIFHGVRLMIKEPTTYLSFQYQGGALIRIYKVEGGFSTQLASTSITTLVPGGSRYWLVGRIEGNVLTVEHYQLDANDPVNTPLNTISYTLTAAERASFGSEVDGIGGFTFDPDPTSDLTDRLVSFRYDPYTYTGRSLPDEFDLKRVPGDAPASVDVVLEKGTIMPYFGMFGWGPVPPGENRVWNGDFEALGTNGWVNGPGSPAVAGATGMTLSQVSIGKYGYQSMSAQSAGSVADEATSFKIYDRFRKGHTYTVEYWYKLASGTAVTPRIALGTSTSDRSFVAGPAAAVTTGWQRATTSWTPGADTDTASVVVTSGTVAAITQLLIDGVKVYETIPTTPAQTEGRGAQPLFGVIEAESAYTPTWAITADANARAGNVLQGTMSTGTVSHVWWVDPSGAGQDEFLDDVTVEFWLRGTFAATAVSPTAVLSARSDTLWIPSNAPAVYTNEYGSAGKVIPFNAANPFLSRLGAITFSADSLTGSRWLLKLDLTFGAASSGTGKLDYIVAVPVNRRFASASGKSSSLSSYTPFFYGSGVSGVQERKRVTSDLAGRSNLGSQLREQPSASVGGTLIEPAPGDIRFVGLVSGEGVPDDPAGVSDTQPAPKPMQAVHFAVTPRYRFVRSS